MKQTRCSYLSGSIQNNTRLFRLHLFLILFASHWLPIVDLRPTASHTQKVVNYVPSLCNEKISDLIFQKFAYGALRVQRAVYCNHLTSHTQLLESGIIEFSL